jgi:hypothetical protein
MRAVSRHPADSAGITLTTPSTGKGTADIIARFPLYGDPAGFGVQVGTARAISGGFWEADLWRSHPSRGPQGPEAGRGPMEPSLTALRELLARSIEGEGPWW